MAPSSWQALPQLVAQPLHSRRNEYHRRGAFVISPLGTSSTVMRRDSSEHETIVTAATIFGYRSLK